MEDDDDDNITVVTSKVADLCRRGVGFGAQPPTYITTIVPPIRSYQQPTTQYNYIAALSMEDDDNDDITVVTSNVAE